MPQSRTYGSATVYALHDAVGDFFTSRTRAFPGATAEQWRRAEARDPASFAPRDQWRLTFRCYAIRLAGATVLVDAGTGPGTYEWPRVSGRLPEELHAAGIDRHDVTALVLTHFHGDHIGWGLVDGEPYFPNARHIFQRAELRALGPGRLIGPLEKAGLVQMIDGDLKLYSGLSIVHTPGHTPGHQSVILSTGDSPLAITGDVIVHALQLVDPAVGFRYEMDQAEAARTRQRLLDEMVGGAVATAHLTEAFVDL